MFNEMRNFNFNFYIECIFKDLSTENKKEFMMNHQIATQLFNDFFFLLEFCKFEFLCPPLTT